jgi:hypothetical protein
VRGRAVDIAWPRGTEREKTKNGKSNMAIKNKKDFLGFGHPLGYDQVKLHIYAFLKRG